MAKGVGSLRSSTVHVETNNARVRWIQNYAQTPRNTPVLWLTCEFLSCFCSVQGKTIQTKFLVPWGTQKFGKDQSRNLLKSDIWELPVNSWEFSATCLLMGRAPGIKQGGRDTSSVTLGVLRALGNSALNWTFLTASEIWLFANPSFFSTFSLIFLPFHVPINQPAERGNKKRPPGPLKKAHTSYLTAKNQPPLSFKCWELDAFVNLQSQKKSLQTHKKYLCFRLRNNQLTERAYFGRIYPSLWMVTGTQPCRHISRRTYDASAQSSVPAGAAATTHLPRARQGLQEPWLAGLDHSVERPDPTQDTMQSKLFCKLQTFWEKDKNIHSKVSVKCMEDADCCPEVLWSIRASACKLDFATVTHVVSFTWWFCFYFFKWLSYKSS